MHRIDTPNSVPDLFGPDKPGFKNGNKATGVQATEFDADWCNSVQESIARVIEHNGGELEKGDHNQLLQAIQAIFDAVDTSGLPVGTLITITGDFDPGLHADYLVVPTAPTTISRTVYPELFARWGTKYGAGDGVTTFGMIYMPADNTVVQASGGNQGTLTTGVVKQHSHQTGVASALAGNTVGSLLRPYGQGSDENTSSTGGPANLAAGSRVIFLVKYR